MTAKKYSKTSSFLTLAKDISTNDLSILLGLARPVVSKLYANRTIKQNGRRGKYDATEAIPQYLESIRTSGAAEAGQKLKVQQERKLRLANDKAAGSLVQVEDAAEAFRQYCLAWRAGANALPRRLANELSNESNPALIQKLIANEFAELFETMEQPLRTYFADAGQTFEVVPAGSNGLDPAPKKKPRRMGRRKKNTTARKRLTRKVAK